jgi:hypothetical protein
MGMSSLDSPHPVTQPTQAAKKYKDLRRLIVTANVFPSLPILVTLMMVALSPYETFILTRATRRNITEGAIPHSHRRENLKSYTAPSFRLEVGQLDLQV